MFKFYFSPNSERIRGNSKKKKNRPVVFIKKSRRRVAKYLLPLPVLLPSTERTKKVKVILKY